MANVTLTRYDITDLNNGQIDGFPVDNPPGWDPISLYYAKALQQMGWNESGQGPWPPAPAPQNPRTDPVRGTPNVANTWNFPNPADPDSYFFWGAMHWWPGERNWEFWNKEARRRRRTNTGRTARMALLTSRSTSFRGTGCTPTAMR